MGWETIENVKPPAATKPTVPPHGVVVSSRAVLKGLRYIAVRIGPELARAAKFHLPEQQVRLMFGSGTDAGKIAVAVDMGGGFLAKKQKSGAYQITINRAAADGLFNLNFPAFAIDRCEAIRPDNGQPPMFTFRASAAMLEVDDD